MRIWRHLFRTSRRWRANELFLPAGNYAVGRIFCPFLATFDTPFRDPWYAVSLVLVRRFVFFQRQHIFYSQCGNILFPRWEYFLPKAGIFFSARISLAANKVGLFNDRGRLLHDKGRLLKIKGALLQDKRHLLQDLTLFFEEVPIYGRFEQFWCPQEVTWDLT